jgi:hypothetical protein
MALSDILGGISGAANGLGNALFPSDPNIAGYIDPNVAAQARNQSLIRLGLGIMQAPYSMTGTAGGVLNALDRSGQAYNDTIDRAFHNTLAHKQLENMQQDREFQLSQREIQSKEAQLGLKQAERSDRTQAATVAQRVLKGLAAAPDKQGYLNLIQNDPDVKDAFSTLGIQPPYAGPMAAPGNVDQFAQQLGVAAAAAPAPSPIKLSQGDVLLNPNDPSQVLASAAPKPIIHTADQGDRVAVLDERGNIIRELPKGITPTQEAKNFAPDESRLMGALSERGVSLPAGMRSQQQMKSTFRGLIDRNPGKTTDEIADMVRTGQLDFNGAKKSTAQLMTQAASANVQASKLEKDFDQIGPLVAKLPDGPNAINRVLVGLKNNLSFGGDKDSAQLVLYIREAATEYAKLSSGSTGSAAPAEGNIKEAMDIFHNAFTQGGYEGLRTAMIKSAQNKRDAVQEGLRAASKRGASTGEDTPKPSMPAVPTGIDGKPLW